MSRTARILRVVRDAFGDSWDLREQRETKHGWFVWIGWPHGLSRGMGGAGGPRAIVTPDLLSYLRDNRLKDCRLPIATNTIKRLRKVLRLDWQESRRQWWEDHAEELASLTGAEFARKHGVSEAIASTNYRMLFGRRIRNEGWWREEPAQSLLKGTAPRAYVAETLDMSIGAVGRLRWLLRTTNGF